MKIDIRPARLIDMLRAEFYPKDRSVVLAPNTFFYLPGQIGSLSMALIAETILSANATSVTFSSIPQAFRHLMLFTQVRTDRAAEVDFISCRFNNDSGSNYDSTRLALTGTAVTAVVARAAVPQLTVLTEAASSRAANFSPGLFIFFGYSVVAEKWGLGLSGAFGNADADADMLARIPFTRWRNTNVITSLVLAPDTGPNFVSGSRFQLYGIL